MPVKWLECNVQYIPENLESKRYHCSFLDYMGSKITLKTSHHILYVSYIGPPGAPYICQGQLKVDILEITGDRATISLPHRACNGEYSIYVKLNSLDFKPPNKKQTVCTFRRKK